MKIYSSLVLAGLLLSGCHAQSAATQFPEKFELVQLQIGSSIQQVQLADNMAKRQQGLMGQIPVKHGMLLLHPAPINMRLWMKNTPSALDVAFFDANWKIVGMTQMQPFNEEFHHSPGPVLGALEMPLGWFAKANITVGQQLTLCKTQCASPTNHSTK